MVALACVALSSSAPASPPSTRSLSWVFLVVGFSTFLQTLRFTKSVWSLRLQFHVPPLSPILGELLLKKLPFSNFVTRSLQLPTSQSCTQSCLATTSSFLAFTFSSPSPAYLPSPTSTISTPWTSSRQLMIPGCSMLVTAFSLSFPSSPSPPTSLSSPSPSATTWRHYSWRRGGDTAIGPAPSSFPCLPSFLPPLLPWQHIHLSFLSVWQEATLGQGYSMWCQPPWCTTPGSRPPRPSEWGWETSTGPPSAPSTGSGLFKPGPLLAWFLLPGTTSRMHSHNMDTPLKLDTSLVFNMDNRNIFVTTWNFFVFIKYIPL